MVAICFMCSGCKVQYDLERLAARVACRWLSTPAKGQASLQLAQQFGMLHGHLEQGPRCARWLAATLLPVLQRACRSSEAGPYSLVAWDHAADDAGLAMAEYTATPRR